jgi:hypothetical protein
MNWLTYGRGNLSRLIFESTCRMDTKEDALFDVLIGLLAALAVAY